MPLFRRMLIDFRRSPHASDLGFEVFIRARARSLRRRYSPRRTPLPSSGSSPPGPHFLRSIAVYRRSPLTTFTRRAFAVRDRARSSSPASLPREARRSRLRSACLLELSSLLPTLRARGPRPPFFAERRTVREARLSHGFPCDLRSLPDRAPSRLPDPTHASRSTRSRVLYTGTVIDLHDAATFVARSRRRGRSVSRSTPSSHAALTPRLRRAASL